MIIGLVNPFLQNQEYANLGGRVAFICKFVCDYELSSADGALGVISIAFVYLFVPELKNKPIYDINWLYVNKIPIRQMKHYKVPEAMSHVIEHEDSKSSEIRLEEVVV